MKRRTWLGQSAAACLALPHWLALAQSAPRRHALLVGVSALAQQAPGAWLQGPCNDVPAMQQALAAHGFDAAHCQVLADNGRRGSMPLPGAGLPTRAAILQSLHALRAKVRAGDAVLLYWSGHALRAPGPPKAVAEADGQSTFLLAHDAARTLPGSTWPLQGALADAELGAWIDTLLEAGAHVLAIMDTCHAASSTRDGDLPGDAPDGLRWRGLRASDLQELRAPFSQHLALDTEPLPATLPAARPRPAGFAGFYACEDMQRTPEWRIAGRAHGVFTHALLQALADAPPPRRYSQWAQRTLDRHRALVQDSAVPRAQWPAPVWEGTLHAPLWARAPMLSLRAADAAGSAPLPLPAGVSIWVELTRPGGTAQRWQLGSMPMARRALGRQPVGTQMVLRIANTSGKALQMRVFYADAQQRWHTVYPELAGDAATLPAGTARSPARWERHLVIDRTETTAESLLWTVAPAHSQQSLDAAAGTAPVQTGWHTTLTWQAVAL